MNTPHPWEVIELAGPLNDYTAARWIIRARQGAPGGIAVIMGGLGADEEEGNAYLLGAALEMRDTLQYIADKRIALGFDKRSPVMIRIEAALAKARPPE
jgi:hypothetical protein